MVYIPLSEISPMSFDKLRRYRLISSPSESSYRIWQSVLFPERMGKLQFHLKDTATVLGVWQ